MINIETSFFIQRLINFLKSSPYSSVEDRQARFEVEYKFCCDATCMEKVDLMPSCDATGQPIDIVGIIRNEYLTSYNFYETITNRHPLLRGGYMLKWNEATAIIEDDDAFYEVRNRIAAGEIRAMFIFHPSVVADVDMFYQEHSIYYPDMEDDYPAPYGLVKCDNCGNLVPRVVAGNFHDEWICNYCYEDHARECEECGEIYWDDDMRYVERYDRWVCNGCFDNHYYTCNHCGEYVHESDVYWGNDGQPYCCDECRDEADAYDSEEDEGEYVKSYLWKPNPKFKGDGDDLFMGIELEVSGQQRHAPEFLSFFGDDYDTYNNVYLKSDCSIQGGGFEIVTHPMTFGYINETFKPMLDKALRHLRREHFAGHNKGGMHIHLSRRAINPDMFMRMYKLLYNSDDKQAWLTVTQRKEEHIDQWARLEKPCISNEDIMNRYENWRDEVLGTRYNALNVTDHTVELRIFNSNLRLERVLKNVECAKAIVEFSKTKRLCKFSSFANFVHENKETYPNLDAFLQERGYNFSAKAFTGAVADDTTESNRELVVDPVEIPY